MNEQLILGVSLKDEATFQNFYAGKNEQLIAELKQAVSAQGQRFIYMYGSSGEGCTHLLHACCHEAHVNQLHAAYVPLVNIKELTPAIFEGLESLDVICLDDLQMIAGQRIWEEAFFHAYNRIQEAGKCLVVAGRFAPKALELSLMDLTSRLTSGVVFQLHALTDTEKLATLIMRAERRGMVLSEEVARFILHHYPRHMSTLFVALDALDKVSLAAQRKLTIPFVKTVLRI